MPLTRRLAQHYPRAWRFLSARLARGEPLGRHLTIGVVLSVAALVFFGALTEAVVAHETTRIDDAVLAWLRDRATPTGYAVFAAISTSGTGWAMTLLAVSVGAVFVVQRRWVVLAGWSIAFAGAGLLDTALKLIVHRPRPAAGVIPVPTSWSFPSGHALSSLVGYGMLAWVLVVLWARGRAARIAIVLGAVLLVLAIGASRLYLGVHYLSDVVGGYAAGIVWLSACVTVLETERRCNRPSPDG